MKNIVKSIKAKKSSKSFFKLFALAIGMMLLIAASVIISNAETYYTVRIKYVYSDESAAFDDYIATYPAGAKVELTVTNPVIPGYTPTNSASGGAELLTYAFDIPEITENTTVKIYYVAGLTPFKVRYYKQNIYDDLYTVDNTLDAEYTERYGYTGSNPTDLEDIEFEGFTNLFHEPEAIAADGSTLFRVYYDRNYYLVSFDLGAHGYGVDPVYAKYQSIYHINEPTRMGYTFVGWARTDKDSSEGFEGTDWNYIDDNGNIITETQAKASAQKFQEGTVPNKDTFYKAMWDNGTTSYSVVYWLQNPDCNVTYEDINDTPSIEEARAMIAANYSVIGAKDVTGVPSDTEINLDTEITNVDGQTMKLSEFFKYNLGANGDFPTMSDAKRAELNGKSKYYELDEDLSALQFSGSHETDQSKTHIIINGDGTTRINVYLNRKEFTLKFFYARQNYNNNNQLRDYFSLTNTTKKFSQKNYSDSTYLIALNEGSWASDITDTLPHVKSEYLKENGGNLEEKYVDYVGDDGKKKYRYYYYEVKARYNEQLRGKWLIDAVTPVHKKNKAEEEICYPGSWAVECGTAYKTSHDSIKNYTIKGIYDKLGDELMFDDGRENYTELHYLLSWNNTSTNGNYNDGVKKVLHFDYNNYVELLPWEQDVYNSSGAQALYDRTDYEDVRPFTTYDDGQTVTKLYGLKTQNIIHTLDSGNQYDNDKYTEDGKNRNIRVNQTAAEMTGYQLECYRVYKKNKQFTPAVDSALVSAGLKEGQTVLDQYNTEIDWSQDTDDYRHATIRFYYKRLEYSLKYRNGNRLEEDHTRTVKYGAPLNSKTDDGEYRYFFEDPQYFNEDLREYYVFDGWYFTPYYMREVDKDTVTMPAEDTTFYAKWVPKKINVEFYANYNDFYKNENRILDPNTENGAPVQVDYGSYVAINNVPADIPQEQIYRPVLEAPGENAMFAGWYYLRDRIPVRFEPERVPVTGLNKESAEHNGTLKLYAEWVTRDVAKYKVNYVEEDNPDVEVANSTTGRTFVYKTKTFDAKSGDELNADHAWVDGAKNWWPTINSHSILVKSNEQGHEYKPNEYNFTYTKADGVYYKVQYLDAVSRTPLDIGEGNDNPKIVYTPNASVTEDALYIPGYVAEKSSITLVLSASSLEGDEKEAEETENNVITFLYNKNDSEYLYEIEYYTQDIDSNNYSHYRSENLTVPIAIDPDITSVAVNTVYSRHIPEILASNGYERVAGATTITYTERNGTATTSGVADNATVRIYGDKKNTIKVYFNRKKYYYSYQYYDYRQANKYYNATPEQQATMWDGLLEEHMKVALEPVGKEITIPKPTNLTYTSNGESIPYTIITDNVVTVTIEPDSNDSDVNLVKIYYKKFTQRELLYRMACVNDSEEVDYDPYTNDALYGGLSISMQTVDDYNEINNVTFYNFNEATTSNGDHLHDHRYTFLGWYTTPNYDPDHPEQNRLTTSETLSKTDLTSDELPDDQTVYYALVKQDMVNAYFEFRYTDENLKSLEDAPATTVVQNASRDPDGDYSGGYFNFSHPSMYVNGTDIPWHRTDGYRMSIEPKDNRVYKYEFAEWWEVDQNDGTLIRKHNFNSSEEWDATSLCDVIFRTTNHHYIAVYTKRNVTELPYSIDYKYIDRKGVERTYTVTGTLTGDALDESSPNCKITSAGAYELTDEFIMENAPFESNYGQTLCWSDKQFVKTSAVGDSDEGTVDRIITTATAVQDSKKVAAHYRLTPDGEYETPIRTTVGANRSSDNRLSNISVGSDTAVNGKYFSYWEVRKSENGNVIAKSYRNTFDLCIMDNYWISPVFSKTASNTKTAILKPDKLATGGEDWLAWTWDNDKSEGVSVAPSNDMIFSGLKNNVIFVRVSDGTATTDASQSNALNKTEELTVADGRTFTLTNMYGDTLCGTWSNIVLTHLDYNRNQWTDSEGEIASSGNTDLLYTDFEIAFSDGEEEIFGENTRYKTGVVFELCAALNGGTFDESTHDYANMYPSDEANLKSAVKTAVKSNKTSGKYSYNGSKNRSFQLSNIPTSELTNRNRIEYSKSYKNAYKTDNEGNITSYTNSTYIMKATAYIVKGDTVTLSNSVFVCLNDIAAKKLAVNGVCVADTDD